MERDFAGVVDTVPARTRIDGELEAMDARIAKSSSEADWTVGLDAD